MILQALKLNIKDGSNPIQIGDESSFVITEVGDEESN